MTRLLVSTSTFPLRPGDGIPRFVFDLSQALGKRLEVFVLAPDAPGAPQRETLEGLEVFRFRYFWPRRLQRLAYRHGMRENFEASLLAKLQPLPYLAAQVHNIRALVRDKDIGIVNSHWLVPQGLSGALARGAKKRFLHVLTIHGGDIHMMRALPGGARLARFVLKRSDALFVSSLDVKSNLDRLAGFDTRAEVQPMGVHTDTFRDAPATSPAEAPFPAGYILFVGRFLEIKGVTYLLRAMVQLQQRNEGLGLVLVGFGRLESQLKEEAKTLDIERSVLFTGQKPHGEVARYLHGCRAVVIPSVIDSRGGAEGMPTVVAEAMAAGARVVASSVGGIPEVVRHGENGWLCREKDPEDLAQAIQEALDDPAESGVIDAARETARGFDWARVSDHYIEVFDALLKHEAAG